MTTATKVIFEVNLPEDTGAADVKKLLADGDKDCSGDLPNCVFQRLMVLVTCTEGDIITSRKLQNDNDPTPVIAGD